MDTEALSHCGQCKHFEVDFCLLRQEVIPFPHSTTCQSNNRDHKVPLGPLHSVVGEINDAPSARFKVLPYLEGHRVEAMSLPGQFQTRIIVCTPEDDLVFSSTQEYLEHREKSLSKPLLLLGAIAGDIIGSLPANQRRKGLRSLKESAMRYSDLTVSLLGLVKALLRESDQALDIKALCRRYPGAGYSNEFKAWLSTLDSRPFCTDPNSVAFRTLPLGYTEDGLEATLLAAERSAGISHGLTESIKWTKAVCGALYLARIGQDKVEIERFLRDDLELLLPDDLPSLVRKLEESERSEIGMREALSCFLWTDDFDSAMEQLCPFSQAGPAYYGVVGALCEAHYHGIPEGIRKAVAGALPDELYDLLLQFDERFHFDFGGYASAVDGLG
ncbi:hypothetical protein GC167_09305 [bacterium]|nr:hypothetical protein [bacterium]